MTGGVRGHDGGMSLALPITRDLRRRTVVMAAAQTVVTCDFPLYDGQDLVILAVDVAGVLTPYLPTRSIALDPVSRQPTITFAVAPRPTLSDPAVTLRFEGRRVHERSTDVTRGGAIRAVPTETELDRIATVLQELRRDADDYLAQSGALIAASKTIGAQPFAALNGESGVMRAGTPSYVSAPGVMRAGQATVLAAAIVAAVPVADIPPSSTGYFLPLGGLALSVAQWNLITGGTGGLNSGSIYFLDTAAPGLIKPYPPGSAGQYVTLIGQAMSPTLLLIQPQQPMLL